MFRDFRFGSRRHAGRRAFRCQCESLEPRIVLSATAAYPDFIATAEPSLVASPQLSTSYPGGVTVTATQIITETETIPRFVANPTVSNVRSGDWSDPSIWSTGSIPADHARVVIAPQTTVGYATVSNVRLDGVEISGSLIFSTSVNTRLTVGTLTVMPTGMLQIGTTANPVAPTVKAELVIADIAVDLANDPKQYGTGLIALGTVNMHGSTLVETWNRLAAEPKAGDSSLLLTDTFAGWRAGDTLVLPDSRQVLSTQDKQFPAGAVPPQWETVTIDHVQGNRVYLTAGLKFNHLGARNSTGGLELLPHVALLTRNVVVRSENPQGTRGHVLFTARAAIDVEYVRFSDLGRTSAFLPLDNTTLDANGVATHVGTNQIGRYAVHFHHLMGPMNATNAGYQFTFMGNTVEGSRKWAVAVHDSSYGLIADNVVYNAQGAGFVTEEGSEINNEFRDNFTIRIQGTFQDGKDGTATNDYGRGGSGFWFHRGGNLVTGNVAADSTYAGFVVDGYDSYGEVSLPKFRGADMLDPAQTITALLTPGSLLQNNEAYGMSSFGVWLAYLSGDNLVPDQPETIFDNLRLWNTWHSGVTAYHTSHLTFDHVLILGDQAAQNRNDEGSIGMNFQTYENRNLVIRNSRIEGVRIGILAPQNDSSQASDQEPTLIDNTVLRNYVNILVLPAQDDRPGNGNALVVSNVLFSLNRSLPVGPAPVATLRPAANIQMQLAVNNGDFANVIQPSTVRVINYNQAVGDNFFVYYREQAANYVVPQTSTAQLSTRLDGLIGSPQAGLTNAQNWSKYRLAVAGSVAPTNATTRADINGLVVPPKIANPVAPQVVLVTPWNGAVIDGTPPVRIRYNVLGTRPEGAQVYFMLDNGVPFTNFLDGGIYSMAKGTHTLMAYIGDARGVRLSRTLPAAVTFTLTNDFGPAIVPAAPSPVAPQPPAATPNLLPTNLTITSISSSGSPPLSATATPSTTVTATPAAKVAKTTSAPAENSGGTAALGDELLSQLALARLRLTS